MSRFLKNQSECWHLVLPLNHSESSGKVNPFKDSFHKHTYRAPEKSLMRREEKRVKFYEAVVNTLYPPPSPPQPENEDEPVATTQRDAGVDIISPDADDFGESSSSSSSTDADNEESINKPQKLTRAQRKGLRKKKLKEDASRRGKIIGPLLPPEKYDTYGVVQNEPAGVRENAAEENAVTEDQGACSSRKKLKRRRMAKKLASEKFKSPEIQDCVQGQSLKSSSTEKCDEDCYSLL